MVLVVWSGNIGSLLNLNDLVTIEVEGYESHGF